MAQSKSKSKSNESVDTLSPDHVDAILRDPNCPDDVRATVSSIYNVSRYLDGVDFEEGEDGYLTVRPASDVEGTAEEDTGQ